ncbi:Lipoyl synthase, mitochondrial [Hordeum vulgare]|nr:Lipoyl synthase, mitochondrial [Hordeum vulgare]
MEREMERIRIIIKVPASESSRFDSGKYSFFGKALLEGLELGGSLVDDAPLDGGYGDGGFGGHDDGAYQLSPVGEEVLAYLSARAHVTIVDVLIALAECSIV